MKRALQFDIPAAALMRRRWDLMDVLVMLPSNLNIVSDVSAKLYWGNKNAVREQSCKVHMESRSDYLMRNRWVHVEISDFSLQTSVSWQIWDIVEISSEILEETHVRTFSQKQPLKSRMQPFFSIWPLCCLWEISETEKNSSELKHFSSELIKWSGCLGDTSESLTHELKAHLRLLSSESATHEPCNYK